MYYSPLRSHFPPWTQTPEKSLPQPLRDRLLGRTCCRRWCASCEGIRELRVCSSSAVFVSSPVSFGGWYATVRADCSWDSEEVDCCWGCIEGGGDEGGVSFSFSVSSVSHEATLGVGLAFFFLRTPSSGANLLSNFV